MKWPFKNLSIDLTVVFAICTVLFGIYAVSCHTQMNKAKNRAETLSSTISSLNQEMKSYEVVMDDSVKHYVGEVKTLNMTVDNLKSRYDKLYAATRIRAEDVGVMATISDIVRDTIFIEAKKDSFGGLSTGYRDEFVNISVFIDSACMAKFDYLVKDSLSLVVSQRKHSLLFGLIKWKEYEKATIINHNPKARVSNVEVINKLE